MDPETPPAANAAGALTTIDPAAVPVGATTVLGTLVAALFAFWAALTAVLHGDHSSETITALVLAGATIVTVMAGRYAQATAARLPSREVNVVNEAPLPGHDAREELADFRDKLHGLEDELQAGGILDPRVDQPTPIRRVSQAGPALEHLSPAEAAAYRGEDGDPHGA